MTWLAAILCGLATGALAAVYAGCMAYFAVDWLRVSQHEGESGYFIVAIIVLGFVGGTIGGVTIGRLLGGPENGGALRGLGYALLIVGGIISAVGAWAWIGRDDDLNNGAKGRGERMVASPGGRMETALPRGAPRTARAIKSP
jgi:hypothetical protein